MYLVVLGLLLVLSKLFELGPFASMPWWLALAPFGLAVAWWAWADGTGYTQRREMDKMEERKAERRRKNLEHLGMDERGRRRKQPPGQG